MFKISIKGLFTFQPAIVDRLKRCQRAAILVSSAQAGRECRTARWKQNGRE